jgi:hypothetical protein
MPFGMRQIDLTISRSHNGKTVDQNHSLLTLASCEERTATMPLTTQAAVEVAHFLACHPTPEQIVAFHPSSQVAERACQEPHASAGRGL